MVCLALLALMNIQVTVWDKDQAVFFDAVSHPDKDTVLAAYQFDDLLGQLQTPVSYLASP